MEPKHQFQDETFTEWLQAMPDTLHWTLAVSPSRMVQGLQDGSLREFWRRESHRMPDVDEGRTELWADSLVAYAVHMLRMNADYRAVPAQGNIAALDRVSISYPREFRSLNTPELSLRLSIAIRDSARARILHAHALLAQDRDGAAMEATVAHRRESLSPHNLKCIHQLLGILEVKSSNFVNAATHFLAADATAISSRMSDEQCWTSLTNLMLCAVSMRSDELLRDSIARMNQCTEISSEFKRNSLRRMLSTKRAEYNADLHRLRSFEAQMGQSTREFMYAIT